MADDPGRFAYDPDPDERAVSFLSAKGLARSWRWPSLWQAEHAHAFTLAGVWRLDVLDAAHRLTTQAVAEGETYETFKRQFRDRMKTLGFDGPQAVTDFAQGPRNVNLTTGWRIRTIYNTNVRAAYAASEWQAIEDTKADFPALEYQGIEDEATRVSHERWFGVVLPVDHIFWRWYFPPNDWGCRCFTLQISIRELETGRFKITSEADLAARGFDADPASWPVWTDRRTGRTEPVPPGIGPGFAYNAGMARRETLANLLAGRIERMDPDMARIAVADLVNLPQFRDMTQAAVRAGQPTAALAGGEAWPVAVAPIDVATLTPQAGRLVVVTPSAIARSAGIHPITASDWRRVQQLLESGEIWVADDGSVYAFAAFRTSGGSEQGWAIMLQSVDGVWQARTLLPSLPEDRLAITRGMRLVRAGRAEILD